MTIIEYRLPLKEHNQEWHCDDQVPDEERAPAVQAQDVPLYCS